MSAVSSAPAGRGRRRRGIHHRDASRAFARLTANCVYGHFTYSGVCQRLTFRRPPRRHRRGSARTPARPARRPSPTTTRLHRRRRPRWCRPRGRGAVHDVGEPRPARDHHDEHALEPAAQVVGGRLCRIVDGTPPTPCRPHRRPPGSASAIHEHGPGRGRRRVRRRGRSRSSPRPRPRSRRPPRGPAGRSRGSQPENTPPAPHRPRSPRPAARSLAPPSSGPPKLSCAICGNSARGMPKTIAIRSTTNDISSTGCAGR